MKGILVIRGGAIGDFICTLPIVAAIRKHLPQTPLSLLSYDRVLPLADATGDFAQVRSLENRNFAVFFARKAELDPEWIEFIGAFGMIFSFLYDPDGLLQANLKRCNVKTIHSIDPRPTDRHAVDHLASILDGAGIPLRNKIPRLKLPSARSARTGVALHPGSGSEKKNWSLNNWRALLEWLLERGLPVTVVAGEAEVARADLLVRGFASPHLNVLRQEPLLKVARALQGVRCLVGHDSGITHLAAALEVPVLALFGPSNPALWAPRGPCARVLRANRVWDPELSSPLDLGEISVDDNSLELVKAQLTQMLSALGAQQSAAESRKPKADSQL